MFPFIGIRMISVLLFSSLFYCDLQYIYIFVVVRHIKINISEINLHSSPISFCYMHFLLLSGSILSTQMFHWNDHFNKKLFQHSKFPLVFYIIIVWKDIFIHFTCLFILFSFVFVALACLSFIYLLICVDSCSGDYSQALFTFKNCTNLY